MKHLKQIFENDKTLITQLFSDEFRYDIEKVYMFNIEYTIDNIILTKHFEHTTTDSDIDLKLILTFNSFEYFSVEYQRKFDISYAYLQHGMEETEYNTDDIDQTFYKKFYDIKIFYDWLEQIQRDIIEYINEYIS